jgi:hypothetical protein
MPSLQSDKVERALTKKLNAERDNNHDRYLNIYDNDGLKVCYTRISHGSKETLSTRRVSEMAGQLRLDNAQSLVNLVNCSLDRDAALVMIKRNPKYAGRFRQ